MLFAEHDEPPGRDAIRRSRRPTAPYADPTFISKYNPGHIHNDLLHERQFTNSTEFSRLTTTAAAAATTTPTGESTSVFSLHDALLNRVYVVRFRNDIFDG